MTATRQVGSESPDKLPDKFDTNNKYIRNLVKLVGSKEMSIKEMLLGLGLKDRESFMNVYLTCYKRKDRPSPIPKLSSTSTTEIFVDGEGTNAISKTERGEG